MGIKRGFHSLFLYSCFLFFVACGKSDSELASEKINIAKELLSKLDTASALGQLDSIPILFPKAKNEIAKCEEMIRSIYSVRLSKLEEKLEESMLRVKLLEKNFIKNKDRFDKYTQYIHKRQAFKSSWDRCFLQVHLDERGELYLSSNYCGDHWLKHTSIRVYDGDLSAKTDKIPLDSPDNRQNDFMDEKWEMVSYRGDKSQEVIDIISKNTARRLKVVFLGKKNYYIVMEEFDKNAVRDAKQFSKSLKRVQLLKERIERLSNKIENLGKDSK